VSVSLPAATVNSPSPADNNSSLRSSFAALAHRDFRLFWSGQFVSTAGSQMQLVAINWHVYLLTKSAWALGMVGLVRVLPIILCSLVGGVVADSVDRKRLLLFTQTIMLVSAATLALLTWSGITTVWPIFLLTALASAATAFDNPARQALLPALVPPKDFANAASLNFVAFQVATVAGPVLAGFTLASRGGPAMVYAVNAVTFFAVIWAVIMIRAKGGNSEEEKTPVNLDALREGWRFVWRTPVIVQTMMLDFVATFFASAMALLPIYAADILRTGPRGLGVLAAAPAVGAVLTGLVMTRRGGNWRRPGRVILFSIVVYGAATIAFGASKSFWFSCLCLAVAGAADTVSTVIRQTIRQFVTPDRLRGRMTSINMIFFMGGPQLGELEAGLMAHALGAPASVVTGGAACLVAVLIAMFKAKELLKYRITNDEERSDVKL